VIAEHRTARPVGGGRSELAGRRWRVGAASRTGNPARRPQPDLAAPEPETRVARNRSTGSTRPATPNHPVGDSSTASGPVGGASHVEPICVEPIFVEPTVVEPTVVEPTVVELTVVEPTVVEPTVVGRRRSSRGRG